MLGFRPRGTFFSRTREIILRFPRVMGNENREWPPRTIRLDPKKRILFLTKDLNLIRQQIDGDLNLKMDDLNVSELLDDINTDVMTPAWVCFDHDPVAIAENAYAGLLHGGKRVVPPRGLIEGNFEVIVSGMRKGTGSSRETAAQCERWSGIRIIIASSFAPIHERNNINLGQLMGDHEMLRRLQGGEEINIDEFAENYDPLTRLIITSGGLFSFAEKLGRGVIQVPSESHPPRPMTMVEKILSKKRIDGRGKPTRSGDVVIAQVDGGYSHEFTTAQVHSFLQERYGNDYKIVNPNKFAVFEDHLLYAMSNPKFRPFEDKISTLRSLQNEFQRHTGVRDYSAKNGVSPGICHQVAREEFIDIGDLILATDSHTCMGGGGNALAYGVGATEYAALIHSGFTFVRVPESIRFELIGALADNCTAKDVMLHILLHYALHEHTLDRVIEFGGEGMNSLSMDERATLCNMATECSAKSGICEADQKTYDWLNQRREGLEKSSRRISPDPEAIYDGGKYTIDLSTIRPMVAHPGKPDKGIPSDPTNGAFVDDIGHVPIDIAYGGSCTAGKEKDLLDYARVCKEAKKNGREVADHVSFIIQFGSIIVAEMARREGLVELFDSVGVQLIEPGCGACIGAGPGVSTNREQITVSAINRNFQGRSGPGKLYLASPLTVAASAFAGYITAYDVGMFDSHN